MTTILANRVGYCCLFCVGNFAFNSSVGRAVEPSPRVQQVVSSLFTDESTLNDVPFAEVVHAATGKRVIPFNLTNSVDRELLAKIGIALDHVLKRMNASDSPAQSQRRINEASAYFEKALREELNKNPGFDCDWPKTAAGKLQHPGYPDLRLLDKASGRVVYLDPKLFEQDSRNSTLRTFYYEPKKETNKILDDAHHLIVGFAHDGGKDGRWKFLSWELVDVSHFNVRLKAEFQGSNRDLYQPAAIVGSSRR